MRDRLTDMFDELSGDLGVRAVVLTGSRRAPLLHRGGARRPQKPDAARPEGAPERAVGDVARMIRRGWQRLVGSILDCEKPVIAAVNGTRPAAAPTWCSPATSS